jgi:hypothetical protein
VTEVEGMPVPGIDEGVEAGRVRAERYELEAPDDVIEGTRNALAHVIEVWPDELHERFIALFAENATVAAIARITYEPWRTEYPIEYDAPAYSEVPFTRSELLAFLAHSAAFFNSFKHR